MTSHQPCQILSFPRPALATLQRLKDRALTIGQYRIRWEGQWLHLGIEIDKSANRWINYSCQFLESKLLQVRFEKRCWLTVINMAEQAILADLYSNQEQDGGTNGPEAA